MGAEKPNDELGGLTPFSAKEQFLVSGVFGELSVSGSFKRDVWFDEFCKCFTISGDISAAMKAKFKTTHVAMFVFARKYLRAPGPVKVPKFQPLPAR